METFQKQTKRIQKRSFKRIRLFRLFVTFLSLSTTGWAQNQTQKNITLSFSDGSADVVGIENINTILKKVGVCVSTVVIPAQAKPILEMSRTRALKKDEADNLISLFYLNREELLEQIAKAGRKPAVDNGGFLSTKEEAMSPYPKVYDMKALSPEITVFLQEKFGKLHVNISENGSGIDEVMTIVSGGPWTWFFVLPNNVLGKLTLGNVGINDAAWRISYPGLGPHGGFFDAENGLVVAFAHGSERFEMSYEEPTVVLSKWMGQNPWVDFSGKTPKLLKKIK